MILKNNMKYELRYFESHCNSTRSSKIKLALGKHLEVAMHGFKLCILYLFTYLLAFAVPFCTKYEFKQILTNICLSTFSYVCAVKWDMSQTFIFIWVGTYPNHSSLLKLGYIPKSPFSKCWD